MRNNGEANAGTAQETEALVPPLPSMQFRRRAWREFQKALDPLAPPKPLPVKRQP